MSIDLLVRPPDYAAQVAANLPAPTEANYQVPYDNRLELIGAMSLLSTIEPVVSIQEIHTQREVDAAVATGELLVPKITVGNCSELLLADFDKTMLAAIAAGEDIAVLESPMLRATVDAILALEDVVYDEMGFDASVEQRAAGQFFKPRSSFTESLKDGSTVYSYFGDGINSRDLQHRRPDPRRLIAARIQARDTKRL